LMRTLFAICTISVLVVSPPARAMEGCEIQDDTLYTDIQSAYLEYMLAAARV
jgi:hypothetical protein